ncbi:MAG: antitermination protein NusB [Verrucomicrobiales bacterium]|nr:antitermination protein NusB [Verrucomicrobiales bacterium]
MLATAVTGSVTTQYAVGWFTLALINAGLAQGKGRSGLAWWVVSLFLGPIATLLIVLLDRVHGLVSPKQVP